jgi:hypothetical protein
MFASGALPMFASGALPMFASGALPMFASGALPMFASGEAGMERAERDRHRGGTSGWFVDRSLLSNPFTPQARR